MNNYITIAYKNLFHKDVIGVYNNLIGRNPFDVKEVRAVQVDKLKKLLKVAVGSVARYKELDIDVENLTYEEFRRIPLLDKDLIKSNVDSLLNLNYLGDKSKIRKNTSGGSTGRPVEFFQSPEQLIHAYAN